MINSLDDRMTQALPDGVFLAITLQGERIELGAVSAGLVCRYTDALRLALQGAIEVVESVKAPSTKGRRKRWVERMADLPLIGVRSGSVQILLGQPSQTGLFAADERESFAQAVELLFQRLGRIADDQDDAAMREMSHPADVAEQRFRGTLQRLMPPRRGPLTHVTLQRHVNDEAHPRVETVTLGRRTRQSLESSPAEPGEPENEDSSNKKSSHQW